MTASQDGGSFFVKFRQQREERQRLESLHRRAVEGAAAAPAAVAQRVERDLASRLAALEEGERLALKTFVQGLKDRKDELQRTEHEVEELDFRRHIGEFDDVELQIRRESLSLKVREQKRNLERDLEEYRALRSFVDNSEPLPAADATPAVPDSTVTFDSFRLKAKEHLEAAPPAPEALPPPAAPPVAAPTPPPPEPSPAAAFPPLVVEDAGLQSIVVNHDFLPRAPEPAADLDDLSQLDVLSKSLERLATSAPESDIRAVAMPAAPPPLGAPALLEGMASSPLLPDDLEDATVLKRPTSESQVQGIGTPKFLLKGQDGGERASFVLKLGVSTIGRGLDNEVVLDDRAVSRKHATVAFEADATFRVTDLGSENGTYVNGVRITSQVLRDGDEVHVGKSTLVFTTGR